MKKLKTLWKTWKKGERKGKPLSIVMLPNIYTFLRFFFHIAQSRTSQPHHPVSCSTHAPFQKCPYGFLELKIKSIFMWCFAHI